jgi:hypothetical protein
MKELGQYDRWINNLAMQESGLLRYTTLTVGREKSLHAMSFSGLSCIQGITCSFASWENRSAAACDESSV